MPVSASVETSSDVTFAEVAATAFVQFPFAVLPLSGVEDDCKGEGDFAGTAEAVALAAAASLTDWPALVGTVVEPGPDCTLGDGSALTGTVPGPALELARALLAALGSAAEDF